jgi:hypothetical protein
MARKVKYSGLGCKGAAKKWKGKARLTQLRYQVGGRWEKGTEGIDLRVTVQVVLLLKTTSFSRAALRSSPREADLPARKIHLVDPGLDGHRHRGGRERGLAERT